MVKKKKDDKPKEAVDVLEVQKGLAEFCILGEPDSGVICNRLSEKVQRELLLPRPKRNATERALLLKHNPLDEFRASPYRLDGGPTLIALPSAAFKKAMMTASLDLPNTKKAQIGRLVWVPNKLTPVFGVPQITLDPVRSADMNRTPDIRSRAILPRWALRLRVQFVRPLIHVNAVTRLLAAGGLFCGVGDWRQEKGSGSFGRYRLCEPDDPEFLDIIATGGREAQIEAMAAPEPYDEETSSLLTWFDEEIARRKSKGVGAVKSEADPEPEQVPYLMDAET